MSRHFPYSFSFIDADGERRQVTIMVHPDRSRRSKKQVFKSYHNWDYPADVELTLTEEETEAWSKGSSMQQCLVFWECMRYTAIRALLQLDAISDTVDEWEDPKTPQGPAKCLISAWDLCEKLPRPKMPEPDQWPENDHWFDMVRTVFPQLDLKKVDIGF